MNYIFIIFLLYFFIKSWFYGLFELKEIKNKPAATAIFILTLGSFIFSIICLYIFIKY